MWLDEKFYRNLGPIPLKKILNILSQSEVWYNCERIINIDNSLQYQRILPLDDADIHDISFFIHLKYKDLLKVTKSSIVITGYEFKKYIPANIMCVVTKYPHQAVARILSLFGAIKEELYSCNRASSAVIGEGCIIAPTAVIGERAIIGNSTIIEPNAVIGHGVCIGSECRIGTSTSIFFTHIGNNVTIHSGVRIGERGFGFSMDGEEYEDMPHFGRVIIGNNIEIGANTTISRGSLRDTIIGDGCKIDQQVVIGHNVQLGKKCILAGQTGIAGSTILEDEVICAGQVGIADHIRIEKKVILLAKSGVMHNLKRGIYFGIPAVSRSDFVKKESILKKILEKGNNG